MAQQQGRVESSEVDGSAPTNEHKERATRNLAELVRSAGTRSKGWSLNSYKVVDPYQREVVDLVHEWAEGFEARLKRGEGLVLLGPVGTGKDHLAFGAVARGVSTTGASALWVACRELFAAARDAMSADEIERRFVRTYVGPDVLILSDPTPPVGEGLTSWQSDVLFRIVDTRWRSTKPTVVTANFENDLDAENAVGAATWDRITDRAFVAVTNWRSFRRTTKRLEPKGGRP